MSGLGGRLQAIVRMPDGTIHGVNASTEAPLSYDNTGISNRRYGYEVIGIPGVVAGLTKLIDDYGSLPIDVIMEPALRYAKRGFPILKGEAYRHQMAIEQIKQFEGTRK